MLLINKTLSIIIIRKMYDTAAISGWGNCLRLTSPKLLLCLSLSVSGFLTHTLLHKVCGHQECVSGEALTQQWVSGCAAVRIPLHIHAHSTAALWFHIGIPPLHLMAWSSLPHHYPSHMRTHCWDPLLHPARSRTPTASRPGTRVR